MLNLSKSTEVGKRIPKQKFYEHLDITPAMRRAFVEQIKVIYWRNKIAATTMNLIFHPVLFFIADIGITEPSGLRTVPEILSP